MKAAILTISDRRFRGEESDKSGDTVERLLLEMGFDIARRMIVPDETEEIAEELCTLSDYSGADLIITTGGTGFSPRDITREATLTVLNRLTPGIDEALRAKSLEITPYAMLSRGVSGIRNETLIINLPGSPKAVVEMMAVLRPVLFHAIQMMKGIDTDNHDLPPVPGDERND